MTRDLPRFSAKTAAFHQLFWVSEQLVGIG
jgi:hypothetical protein